MITPDQILFLAGGRSLALYGTPHRRTRPKTRGGEEFVQTFSRSGTGSYVDRDGEVKLAESGLQRITMVDLDGDGVRETPTILLEDIRTNGFTKSHEIDNIVWTKARGAISANAGTAPDGLTTADLFTEDSTSSSDHTLARVTGTLADSTQQSFSLFAKPNGRNEILLRLSQKDGTTATVWFNLAAGTVGTVTGSAVGRIEAHANDWFRCSIAADSASGGTTPQIIIFLGSGSETYSYNGDGSSGVFFWGMQLEVNKAMESSYVATAASTVARAQESLAFTLNAAPQASSWYLRFIERGSILQVSGERLFNMGDNSGARLYIWSAGSRYRGSHNNGSSTVTAIPAAGPSVGDVVEVLLQIDANGAVTVVQSINGAAEITTATTADNALASAWNNTNFRINSETSTSLNGFNAFIDVLVVRGVHSLADCRTATQQ
jgi:hypothetical protein